VSSDAGETILLWRPVVPVELELMRETGMRMLYAAQRIAVRIIPESRRVWTVFQCCHSSKLGAGILRPLQEWGVSTKVPKAASRYSCRASLFCVSN
jgi:hypothetical protein